MQGITRNPIAEPSVMGITQGATFMIAVAFVLQRIYPNLIINSFSMMMFAFVGSKYKWTFSLFCKLKKNKKSRSC